MSFLGGLFLMALPLIGIPIAIHMMKKRRRDVVPWGAMQFLRDPNRRGQKISQLDRLLLLAARVLLIGCLIGALSQPLLRWGQSSVHDGLPLQLVLIDDTGSTLAGDTFASMRDSVIELIDTFPNETPLQIWAAGVPARLIASNHTTQSSVDNAGEGVTRTITKSRGQIQQALSQFRPRGGRGDFVAAIQQVTASALAGNETENTGDLRWTQTTEASVDVWLFADNTIAGWTPPVMASAVAANKNRRLHLMQIPQQPKPYFQLAVGSVQASRRTLAKGDTVTVSATIINHGRQASPEVAGIWKIDGKPIGNLAADMQSIASMDAGSQRTIETELSFDQPGTRVITFDLNLTDTKAADSLAADDVGHVVVQVLDQVPLLVITPVRSTMVDGLNDADYLSAALGRNSGRWKKKKDTGAKDTGAVDKADWQSVFTPEIRDADHLDKLDWQRFPVIAWVSGTEIPESAMRQMVSQVRRGTGLWITLDSETDPAWINQALGFRGLGMETTESRSVDDGGADPGGIVGRLVVRLGEDKMQRLHPPEQTDPVIAALADTQRLDLDSVRIRRRIELTPPSQSLASRVLLRTFEGDAVALLSSVGQGRVMVQGLPMNPSWSNFPLSKSFVVWVTQILDHLAQPRSENFNLVAGQMFRHDVESVDDEFRLTLPGGGTETLVALPTSSTPGSLAGSNPNGSFGQIPGTVRFDQTERPGLYRLKNLDDKSTSEIVFSVSPDADESKIFAEATGVLEPLVQDNQISLHRTANGFDFGSLLSAIPKRNTPGTGVMPLWPMLLFGLVVAIALETFLAGYASLRRYGGFGKTESDAMDESDLATMPGNDAVRKPSSSIGWETSA